MHAAYQAPGMHGGSGTQRWSRCSFGSAFQLCRRPALGSRRVYLEGQPNSLLALSFSEWVRERRELKFLLSQLDLN
jgi:hypothetical protein